MSLRALQEAMRAALHDRAPEALGALLAPGSRPDVYAGMYWARLVSAMRQDFPATAERLGTELFDRVAVTHVKRRPSQHPSLAWLGRGFDTTLTELGLEDEAEVARLEIARNEAFWTPDTPALDARALGVLGDDLAAAVLTFHPSVRIVDLAEGPRVVWRQADTVSERPLEATEARALFDAMAGAPVGAFFEAFLDGPAPEADALGALLRWLEGGLIVATR